MGPTMPFMQLPVIPPELKSMSPYLQRADELVAKDPVIPYWCAYYAAQAGIARKPKDPSSRKYLFDLLGALEHLKAEIGDNDAVHDESAASAYVENFALKVFVMADNEDRRGEATRGTAKKFLAAANFLEILRTFNKESKHDAASLIPDSTEEKIRYSKWKAADIAKAFREGRRPAPGPAGSEPDPERAPAAPLSPALTRTSPPPAIIDLPRPQQDDIFQHVPPPAHVPDVLMPHSLPGAPQTQSPAWSTAASPGTPGRAANTGRTMRAYVSDELEGRSDGEITPAEGSPSRKEVRFAPSATDGLSPPPQFNTFPPPVHPQETGLPEGFVPETIHPDPSAPPLEDVPPGFVPAPTDIDWPQSHAPAARANRQHSAAAPPGSVPVAPPWIPSYSPASSAAPLSPDAHILPHLPPPPVAGAVPTPVIPVVPPPVPPVPVADASHLAVPELTPMAIGRAQKHCRFAISALDYEDAEQARKELRTALKLLGG